MKEKIYKARSISIPDEDWELLGNLAESSGYTKSAYIRMLLHFKRPMQQPSEDWKALYKAFAATGNNINQIARMGHINGIDCENCGACKESYAAILQMRDQMLHYTQPEDLI